jgi:hypothetical protein
VRTSSPFRRSSAASSPLSNRTCCLAILAAALLVPPTVTADTLTTRGFLEVTASGFPQTAPNDRVQAIAEVLFEWNVAVTKGDWRFDGSVQAQWDTHQSASLT